MTLIINGNPEKFFSVLRMIIKNESLFGKGAAVSARLFLKEFFVYNKRIYFRGNPVEELDLPDLDDPAKKTIVFDWCQNHGIEIKMKEEG